MNDNLASNPARDSGNHNALTSAAAQETAVPGKTQVTLQAGPPTLIGQLTHLVTSMLESPTRTAALQSCATVLKQLLDAADCQILELTGEDEVIVTAFSRRPSFPLARMLQPSGPLGKAWTSGSPRTASNLSTIFPNANVSALLCAVLSCQAGPLLLVVTHAQPDRNFTTQNARTLQQLVKVITPVLAQLERQEQLQHEIVEHERLTQDAKVAQRTKIAFLARMSHDLRTPLSSVLGFAQLLELERLSKKQREYVQMIYEGGQRLMRLTDQVLDFTQVDAGKLTLITQPIIIKEAVREAVNLVTPQARNKHIHVSVHQQPGTEQLIINADLQRLIQVLLNLLSNAIKYTPDRGKVQILIGLNEVALATVSVQDTGPGIPANKLPTLFTPFERLGLNSETGGAGLGLTLTKALTEAMGGAITVKSKLGTGSAFTITFPVSKAT